MDRVKTDLLLQFILLVAGQEDDFVDRQLGPIHLIKYVYLADLLHASKNNGQTYTGAKWRFYHYGPWTENVYERIDPALEAIGAKKTTFQSDYDDRKNWYRWQIEDDHLLQERGYNIPVEIKGQLVRLIHTFGKSTPDLLHHVYFTAPMRSAAPDELLDFSLTVPPQTRVTSEALSITQLTIRKKKKLKKGMQQLKERFAAQKAAGRTAMEGFVDSPIEPRYDDVYFSGLEWLNGLAGAEIPEGQFEAVFSANIWKSPTRTDNDVS